MNSEDHAGPIAGERFRIESRLGAGGFGEVYRAFDRKRNAVVALKTLYRADATSQYRFKQEFRSLADLVHPNLVRLYELFFEEDRWFFTMELVDGCDFLEYVRCCPEPLAPTGTLEDTNVPTGTLDESAMPSWKTDEQRAPSGTGSSPGVALRTADPARLQSALVQLVEGVSALHAAGKVHRDLKPSNVLVSNVGRVVLLDFGLAREIGAEKLDCGTVDTALVGTPLYMSPEQARAEDVTEATDWYSVGVMLYQALAGRPPFSGRNVLELVQRKLSTPPPRPSDLASGVPGHLDALCMDLLQVSADKRPSREEILGRLRAGAGFAHVEPRSRQEESLSEAVFVGRKTHLAILEEAYRSSRSGRAVAVYVHGRSGMGKTKLVQWFLEDLRAREPVVVLKGRCYQQESVPYKAFDGVVDALTRYLRQLPQREAALLVPRNVRHLLRLFPVLARVEVLADASRQGAEIADPQEVKRRAFGALKELLARLGDRHSVVAFMDDLQWGDLDSALLLREVLWGHDQPCMLVIGCYRSEEAGASPMLEDLLSGKNQTGAESRTLEISELSEQETLQLAERLLPGGRGNVSRARAVAAESGGVPFLVAELVRFVSAMEGPSLATRDELVKVDELMRWRASRLPGQARRLLEVVAVAARPTPASVCMRAAGQDSGELRSLALLRSQHLVQVRRGDAEEEISTYHDSIRESVVAALDEESLRSYHLRLAENLESTADADPELLMGHFLAGGESGKAEGYALRAAESAFASLAFDRAARLYRLALELGDKDDKECHDLLVKLGDSLANAYRGREAAEVYLRATSGQSAETALQLRHQAAYQFLATGHMKDGVRVARDVLASVGMRLPGYSWLDLVRLLLRRTWVRIRGVRFRERSEESIDTNTLLRVDACYTVGMSMAIVDPLFGMLDFSTRHVIFALRAGEPSRVSLALSAEGATLGILGNYNRARRIGEKGLEIAKQIGDPFVLGVATLHSGIADYWAAGAWSLAQAKFVEAIDVFTSKCTRASVWLTHAIGFELVTLYYMGRMRELSRRHPILERDARERRDLCAQFLLCETETLNVVRLAADDVRGAKEDVRAVFVPTGRENPFYNWHRLAHTVDRELYAGNFDVVRGSLSTLWSAASHSQAFRIPLTRCLCLLVYGRGLIGSALGARGSEQAAALKSVERAARRLERLPMSFCCAGSQIVRAGAASVAGDTDAALSLATAAAQGFDAADMALHATVCRRRRGELLGGDEGRALIEEANAEMARECIVNPDRWATLIAPGKWTAG